MQPTRSLRITWLGHGTFRLVSPGGKHVLVDAWVQSNPACPEPFRKVDRLDVLLLTHGHFDHLTDAVAISRATRPAIVAQFELCAWLESKGLQRTMPMNKGGSQEVEGLRITMVHAEHSSSIEENGRVLSGGEPVGYIVGVESGKRVYFAGDTALFGDMSLIRDLYHPEIAVLPIGDVFTMGPEEAARACALAGARDVIPGHYGTFPLLTGTPARLRELTEHLGIRVHELQPGGTVEF